jgi:hypothetical protein
MSRNVLLLTATISPLAGIPSLARTDPRLRLHDYERAFTFYTKLIGTCFDAIIFAENSKSDLSTLQSLVEKANFDKIEFISFYGLDYPATYGRGYGEFRLVEHVMQHSQLITTGDIIWKVTGRYIIENLCEIVKSRPCATDLYCHMRNYRYRLCELYLLAWNSRGYEAVIKDVFPKLRNDITPGAITVEETLFRKEVDKADETINVVPRFKVIPIISGVRGWDNRNYSTKWSFKNVARRVAHFVLPSLWI